VAGTWDFDVSDFGLDQGVDPVCLGGTQPHSVFATFASRLIVRHRQKIDVRAHYAEWVELVNGKDAHSPEFEQELSSLMASNYSIHHHAWIDRDMKEIIQYTRDQLRLEWRPVVFWNAHFYRKETVFLRKRA
jgi:hypothetical protein